MRATQPSITAENNAAVRAYESLRPSGHRICEDPFARYFLSDELSRASDPAPLLEQMMTRWNQLVPGVCDAILVRTRFIDECLQEAIDRGLQQLVILGAGYDTRALRFDLSRGNTAVFELDHPATQEAKQQRLKKHRLQLPDDMTFIPCQFEREDFTEKLLAGGYNPSRTTFFIWEGVTYYLATADVERTLSFIARQSPAGSAVVFDYFPPSVVNGTSLLDEAKNLRQALQQMGEEILFGIEPDDIEDFLAERGLALQNHYSSEDIRHRFLKHLGRPAIQSAMFYFVVATVCSENITV